MDTNIIYNIDCVAGMNQMIDEASIDLIIADPPYFKVIGENGIIFGEQKKTILNGQKNGLQKLPVF